LPYLLVGVLLVVGCTAAVLATVLTLGGHGAALVLTRPVVAGQRLAPGDVRSVSLSADPGLDLLEGSVGVVGRPVAYSLPAGTVLTRGVLGPVKVPPPGLGVVAVAAAPGQFPPDLAAGTPVAVIQVSDPTTSATPAAGAGGSWAGVVLQVTRTASEQTTVITVQLPAGAARQVAAIPAGQLSVVAETGER
jgi:hypothetical protein